MNQSNFNFGLPQQQNSIFQQLSQMIPDYNNFHSFRTAPPNGTVASPMGTSGYVTPRPGGSSPMGNPTNLQSPAPVAPPVQAQPVPAVQPTFQDDTWYGPNGAGTLSPDALNALANYQL